MTDVTDRVAVPCPACSPEFETVHEVLSEGGQATVKCTECGHVHKTTLPEETTLQRDVVVSQDGESFTASADVPAEETLAVGEEFLLETDEAIMSVRITSLELDENRVEEAPAEDVRTIWTRAVGNVSVNATIHPKGGDREGTRSEELHVPGDYEFVVGETDELGDLEFTIEGIHLREDAHGYNHEKLDHDGDMAFAKDIKRLLVRDESSTAWSAW
ncbi:HVO_0476 family zinc finger protein [Halapricum hydrolyticum]|uniref:HVO_0476 family zinc finger protein n=1 Tax=Halapricum hydrolyticum TaxID=2979991 RepID=A0AAE3LI82_9EURY|nr:HVO_0476 family zinc finger protein [Halapricum hydrolyticum]MCU4718650.1 HVO_0476 family zinc finger protein [Halapricum hydrolyticum]MCU4727664.1 HVO_0476 family zinc finger protein [Halapricum hydrolyticum]